MHAQFGTLTLQNIAIKLRWSNDGQLYRYACNRYHNTSSVTDMLQTLTWPSLQQRRLKTKLIMFYKIVHHIVAIPTTILIPTDPRIRQCHPFTYRHLHAFKDPYKYSFFPNTIIHWNLLPQTIVLCPTVNMFIMRTFKIILFGQ